jgi:uncharacterized membrane protein
MRTTEVAMIGILAALYAVIGRLTDLGIVAPVVGVVAFWPAAVIPAIFAVLYGPWTAGIGAGIGIFIRDMLFHGNALLSLTVGVPANFFCFFIIGYLAQRQLDWRKITLGWVMGVIILGLGIGASTVLLPSETSAFTGISALDSFILFFGVSAGSLIIIVALARFWPEWKNYGVASVIGLGVGSTIIGIFLWVYNQFLPLPGLPEDVHLLPYAILLYLVWTFATEIPFIMMVGPPVLKACFKAFPNLVPKGMRRLTSVEKG